MGTWSFKCNRKPDWTISKFRGIFFVRGYSQKILYPETLKSYSTVVQWFIVRFMLDFRYVLSLQSQSIDFANAFSQANISSGGTVFVEITMDFNSDGGQCDVVIILKESMYGQSEATLLWYEKL